MKILSNLPDTDAGTTERPDGAVKDVSSPGAGDGTPFRADWHNDHYYALLALMDAVGIAADDSDEEFEAGTGSSQFLSAMRLFVQEWAYPGLDFGLQNISGGNQTSDITIYESGGGSEKEDGFTVRLHWTGGDGTFNHAITSAYTIGNELAGFIASSNWQGDGAGELVLRLDKTNSKWLVLTPGIWDRATFTAGEFRKFVDLTLECRFTDTNTFTTSSASGTIFASGPITLTFPIAFKTATIPDIAAAPRLIALGTTGIWQGPSVAIATNIQFQVRLFSTANSNQGQAGYIAKGFWA